MNDTANNTLNPTINHTAAATTPGRAGDMEPFQGLTGSVVSYPTRCPLWGDGNFRGNCDGRLFLALVLRYQAKRVADPMAGSGTTQDAIQWLNRERRTTITFWGGDLRAGFNLLRQDLPGKYDFVWVHPPYWNIVRYSEHPDDLSNVDDYSTFRRRLRLCLTRCAAALLPGGRLVVLVGDVRRQGTYTPIVRDVLSMDELGQLRSIIIKIQHRCRSGQKNYAPMQDVPIRHEYCVIFQKT